MVLEAGAGAGALLQLTHVQHGCAAQRCRSLPCLLDSGRARLEAPPAQRRDAPK